MIFICFYGISNMVIYNNYDKKNNNCFIFNNGAPQAVSLL